MSIFGWSLPPGCTDRHIEEAYGIDYVCVECLREDEMTEEEIEEIVKEEGEDCVELCRYHKGGGELERRFPPFEQANKHDGPKESP